MSLLINLTGPRGSGKTHTATKLAGEDAFRLSGGGLSSKTRWDNVPSDRNWLVDGEAMTTEDLRALHAIAEGHGPCPGPALIVVDNGNVLDRLVEA